MLYRKVSFQREKVNQVSQISNKTRRKYVKLVYHLVQKIILATVLYQNWYVVPLRYSLKKRTSKNAIVPANSKYSESLCPGTKKMVPKTKAF